MPRPSSVDQLPPDILEKLQALLRDPRCTQLEVTRRINEHLANSGASDRISKSAVNRYSLRMAKVGERLQQSREIADMWIAKLGAEPQGKVGNLINEMLRTLSFDAAMFLSEGSLSEESLPGTVEALKELALTMMRLEKAASLNVEREAEIRDQARKEAAETAAEVAKQGGLSQKSIAELRRAILGIRG